MPGEEIGDRLQVQETEPFAVAGVLGNEQERARRLVFQMLDQIAAEPDVVLDEDVRRRQLK